MFVWNAFFFTVDGKHQNIEVVIFGEHLVTCRRTQTPRMLTLACQIDAIVILKSLSWTFSRSASCSSARGLR